MMMARPLCAIVCLLQIGCDSTPPAPAPDAGTGTVTMVFEFPDAKRELEIPNIREGETLETVMRSVAKPHVVVRGSTKTAFVESIGDQATNGSEGLDVFGRRRMVLHRHRYDGAETSNHNYLALRGLGTPGNSRRDHSSDRVASADGPGDIDDLCNRHHKDLAVANFTLASGQCRLTQQFQR